MKIEISNQLSDSEKAAILILWNNEYPAQISYSGIEDFEAFLGNHENFRHFLLKDDDENIKGWLATFRRGGERWFSIIVDSRDQKKGYGTMLLNKVKESENELNGWVVDGVGNLKLDGGEYFSPIEFYKKNGFEILYGERLESENLSAVKIKWKSV